MTESQQRFLRAIAGRIPPERVVEVRLFPPLQRGPVESGVAVVAVEGADIGDIAPARQPQEAAEDARETEAGESTATRRFSIITARYRLMLKGPDRGKWAFEMVHDADAPLETVERVVQGVARRVGEDGEPALLSAAGFHRALSEPWWSA